MSTAQPLRSGRRTARAAAKAAALALLLSLPAAMAVAQGDAPPPPTELFAADMEQQFIQECDAARLQLGYKTCTEDMLAWGRGGNVPFDQGMAPFAFEMVPCEDCRSVWRFYCRTEGIGEVGDLIGLTIAPAVGTTSIYEALHAAGIGVVASPSLGQVRSLVELDIVDCVALPVIVLADGGGATP
jgi:hypothetical protein